MRFAIIPLAAIAFVAISCSLSSLTGDEKNPDFVPVVINDEYSIDIPSYMTKTTLLNDDASLQFQNVIKETYVIVIDESKQEFIDALVEADMYDSARSILMNYADTQLGFTTSAMDVIAQKALTKLKIHGLSAAKTELDGAVEGIKVPISYFVTFIEGEEKLYMVMAWTLQERKERFNATFEKIARTFKLVKNKPVALN